MQISLSASGRQKALSAGASLPSAHTVDGDYRLLQTQYIGVFGVMPALMPGGSITYGVPFDIAQAMASRAIIEIQTRLDLLSPDARLQKIQKLVYLLKNQAAQVVLVLNNTKVPT
jgi:hypothetical protein